MLRNLVMLGTLLVVAGAANGVAAQEQPDALPADYGFGDRPVAKEFYFADEARGARVDRRDELDASSDRVILWPSANTPAKGTLALSNHMVLLSQLSYSFTDDFQLTGSLVVPLDVADTHVGLSGKITLSEGVNHTFSIAPFGQFHQGRGDLPVSDFGLGAAALVDLKTSNNLVTTLGAVAYGSVMGSTTDFSYDGCQSRQDYLDGTCRGTVSDLQPFPSSGHFVAVQAGLTWYILDQWSLRGELMTGYAAGSTLGTEWITRPTGTEGQSERLQEGTGSGGFPYGSSLTAGLGLQWSNGMFAIQMSGYALQGPGQFDPQTEQSIYFTPMLNVGASLF